MVLMFVGMHAAVSAQSVTGETPKPVSAIPYDAMKPEEAKAYFNEVQAWAAQSPANMAQLDANQQSMLKNDDYLQFAAYHPAAETKATVKPVQYTGAASESAVPVPVSTDEQAKQERTRQNEIQQAGNANPKN
jgi:hypothetical protein